MNTKTFVVTITSEESLDQVIADEIWAELIHSQLDFPDQQTTVIVEERIDPFA